MWDITPRLHEAFPVYPGDAPLRVRWLAEPGGPGACVSVISLTPHDGAHVDAPMHLFPGAGDAASIDPGRLIGRAWVHDLSRQKGALIGPELLRAIPEGETRVLLKTREGLPQASVWSPDFRALSPEGAAWLAGRGPGVVGIDTPSVDPAGDDGLPAHRALLSRGVLILENLDLSTVPEGAYELIALPLPLEGVEASPVRAVLRSLSSSL